jgi:hypothetical protein
MPHVAELDSIRVLACHVQTREEFFLPSYFIIFFLPNIYMQIRTGVTLAWFGNAMVNVASATPSPAKLDIDIMP